MTKILVLYYSSYGHIETMAGAVAEGARGAGAHVDVKRVPELVPADVAKSSHFKLDQAAPIAKVDDLVNYDAIVIGVGTRFGRICHRSPASLIRRAASGREVLRTERSAQRVHVDGHAAVRAEGDNDFLGALRSK